jgi:hypothetical protein
VSLWLAGRAVGWDLSDEGRSRIRRRIGWLAPLVPQVKISACEINSQHFPVPLGPLSDHVGVIVVVALETVSLDLGVMTSHGNIVAPAVQSGRVPAPPAGAPLWHRRFRAGGFQRHGLGLARRD